MSFMAKDGTRNLPFDEYEAASESWPAIESYTTKDGFPVTVYKAAWSCAGSNKFSVRPKGINL